MVFVFRFLMYFLEDVLCWYFVMYFERGCFPSDAIKFSYSPQEQGVTMLTKLAEEFDVTVKEVKR